MKNKILILLLPVFIGLLAISCYPEGPEYTSDYDLVGSVHDPDFFESISTSTFIMPDTIVVIKDENDTKEYLTDEQEQIILNKIRSNFEEWGWIDSTSTADTMPDVVITVTAIATKVQGAWWYYWGWYGWGGYYPGWGYPGYPGYPWYPPSYPVYYEYTTGSLIIDMIDWKSADPNSEYPPFVWAAALNGLVNRVPVNTAKIEEGIDKIFELSPYLDIRPS